MIRFFIRRLLATIPTIIGISLVTFVLLNLGIYAPEQGWSADPKSAAGNIEAAYGRRLPLFVNLELQGAEASAEREIARLADDRTSKQAKRAVARAGGAWLPYVVPALSGMSSDQRERALDALDEVAKRIGVKDEETENRNREIFWKRYWAVFGPDFTAVRAARLVQRLVRSEDSLAHAELVKLDTYCLPQLMDALDRDMTREAQSRLVRLAGEIASIDDPLDPDSDFENRKAVLARWKEWWGQRYDMYTEFEGTRLVVGAVTETRYFRWLNRILTLDFGVSTRDNLPILGKLADRLPVTLLLSLLALLSAYAIAVPLGIFSAVRRGSWFDRSTSVALFVILALPTFWVGMLLVRYLGGAGHLNLFPAQGLSSPGSEHWPVAKRLLDAAHHLVLPVLCLSYVSMAALARYQRAGMLQVIDRDFMLVARAKGLTRTQVILRHGLRNGIIPVVAMIGLQLPYLVGGSVVVELIFGIPGVGFETFEAIRANDQPWLMAVVTVTAAMTLIGVVAADVLCAIIDPRIAPGHRAGRPQ